MRTKWKWLTSLVAAMAVSLSLCFGFAFAEEKTYTTNLHSGFGAGEGAPVLGTWKQTEADAPEKIDELVGEVVAEGEVYAGNAYLPAEFNGLANGENFTIRFDTQIPVTGGTDPQVGFNFRAARSNNWNPYEGANTTTHVAGGVLVRLSPGGWFVLNNNSVVKQGTYAETASAGDTVTVSVKVSGTSMELLIKKGESVVVDEKEITGIVSHTENAEISANKGNRAGFYLNSVGASFSNIVVTDGKEPAEDTYQAYPFAAKPMTETLAEGFGGQMRLGTWKQTEDSDPTKIIELLGVVESTGAHAGKGFLDADLGGLANATNFTISYDAVLGNGQVGFNFRAAKTSNYNPYEGYGGVLVRLDAGALYVLSNGNVKVNAGSYDGKAGAGDTVTVTITVTGESMDLVVAKGTTNVFAQEGIEICSNTANIESSPVSALRAGFYLEGTGLSSSFSNIVVTSGNSNYKAYPFEVTANTDFPEAEGTEKINPNFTVMCGKMKEGEDGAFIQGTDLHVQKETAAAISSFGNAYGKNFTVEFDVTMPTAAESDAKEDAGSGFFFRAPDPTDTYSGNSLRVQKDMAFLIVPGEDGKANMTGFVFVSKPAAGALVHVVLTVKNDTATVSFRDVNNSTMLFRLNNTGSELSEYTVANIKSYDEENETQYAGIFTSKSYGKIKGLVMTNETGKSFQAWPFVAGKEDLSDNYVIRTTNPSDRVVEAVTSNPDFDKNDYDIIQDGFPYIIYTEYDGQPHDLKIQKKDGSDVESGYTVTINYKRPPYTTMLPWEPQTDAERHGIYVTIADADGYVYANIICALRICAKELTISGVTAVDRPYDGTRVVQLTGGTLVGVPEGLDIGFTLGEGQLTNAAAGTNKEVETYIALTGADAKNFTLKQPALTVNITKGVQAAPQTPELTVEGNKITVKATDEDDYLEFKLDDGEWQERGVFENVPGGEHTVYVRYREDGNYAASEAASATVKLGSGCGGCNRGSSATSALVFGLTALAAVAVKRFL